jgi:hypothetical protein
MVFAVSLVLVPATVLAQDGEGNAGLAQCQWDPWPKWWDNPISHDLYLQSWGRTPIQAMSRLGGLCGPDTLCKTVGTSCPGTDKSPIYGDPNSCPGGCTSCRTTPEPGALAICSDPNQCHKSLSETACEATGQEEYVCPSSPPVFENKLPKCGGCWGVSLAFAGKSWAGADLGTHPRINNNHPAHFGTSECTGGNKGGDWGLTGCPHTECCTLSWCLQDNCFTGEKCAPN